MYYSGGHLKIGDDVRTPGQPVPEFASFKPRVQARMIRLGRVVLMTDEQAQELREQFAAAEEQKARDTAERKLRETRAKLQKLEERRRARADSGAAREAQALREAIDALKAQLGIDEPEPEPAPVSEAEAGSESMHDDEEGGGPGESLSDAMSDLLEVSRQELLERAEELGVKLPSGYANKETLAQLILEHLEATAGDE